MTRPSLLGQEATAAHAWVAARLAEELGQVERIFDEQLVSDLPEVNELCRYVERYRGKMLRPSLMVLSGMAARGGTDPDAVTERHRMIGAVVEMIHMATLVHDDVLDDAEIRRRGRTVNSLRGNETAVILGDYLISNAFHLCSRAGEPWINLALGEITNTLCEGELVQLAHRDDLALDESRYFDIVRRKTASLVAACCRIGARLSGANEALCQALGDFGHDLGVAFQIQDDLLDLEGHPDIVGKSLGRDLAKGKLTLPVILHLGAASADRRRHDAALALVTQRDVQGLLAAMRASGSLDRARERAMDLVARARARLSLLPPGPAHDFLADAAASVVRRDA
ncbi:MAG: polyprenyl synthetase family protein [Phycisphaeraceae bacterium]|nr:polyprenyl synthetase family protein [Phycisphaeraceae bacterium]